jgi:hypothetical protein
VELADGSSDWPCDLVAAKSVQIKVATAQPTAGPGGSSGGRRTAPSSVRAAEAQFEPSQLQDLGDAVPRLLDIKARTNVQMRFQVRLEIGDGVSEPDPSVVAEINRVLETVGQTFRAL